MQSVTSIQAAGNELPAVYPHCSVTLRCIQEMTRIRRIDVDVLAALADVHYHRYLTDPSGDGGRWAGRLWNAMAMPSCEALDYLAQWS